MTYYDKFFAYLFRQELIYIITIPEISRDAPLILFRCCSYGSISATDFSFHRRLLAEINSTR